MRILVIALLALAINGCSSKGKKDDKSAPAAVVGVGKTKTGADGKKKAEVTLNTSTEGQVTCKMGEETRTLTVTKDDAGCKTIYNKGGADTEVASGKASGEFCQSTMDKIKGNLENAGYVCN